MEQIINKLNNLSTRALATWDPENLKNFQLKVFKENLNLRKITWKKS